MRSNFLTTHREGFLTTRRDGQLELLMSTPPKVAEIPEDVIAAQPNLTAAINLCISASGLEDKEIYIPLRIDPGHWTRIRQGKAHFPVDQLESLHKLCGNDAPLRWLARRGGYNLVQRQDQKDKLLRDAEQKITELENEIETLIKYGIIKKP
jgi:hypothetical protein